MDPRLLHHYNRELQHVREMGAEFAQAYPKVAGRLGMSGIECADPYVERLLEGFAFLSARVQVELEAQQPAFAQHLTEMLYPHFLSPVPSMAVVELQPEQGEGIGPAGHVVPRGSALRSLIGHGDRTACEYRTAHAVTLLPLRLTAASYLTSPAALATLGVPVEPRARAGLRLVFNVDPGCAWTCWRWTHCRSSSRRRWVGRHPPRTTACQCVGICGACPLRGWAGADAHLRSRASAAAGLR